MTFSIVLPSATFDHENFSEKSLKDAETRREVYFYEAVQGYVVCNEEFHGSDTITLLAKVTTRDGGGNLRNQLDQHSLGIDTRVKLDKTKAVWQSEGTTIWKFHLPSIQPPGKRVSSPHLSLSCELTKCTKSCQRRSSVAEDIVLPDFKLNVSELNGSDYTTTDSREALTNESTTEIESKTTDSVVKTELSIPIVMALVIKMKSTKPAGRNNLLLVALSLERSEEIFTANKRDLDLLYFNISSLELSSVVGTATPMNEIFPQRMRLEDSLNVVFKLDDHERFGREASEQVCITTCLTIEKLQEGVYTRASNLIQTNWRPYLDLGLIAPPINNALKTNSNTSHLSSQMSNSVNGTNIRQRAMLNNLYKMDSPTFSNLNTNLVGMNGKRAKSYVTRESSSSVTVNLSTNINSSLAGLKLTFIGRLDMKQGVVTKWKMQAINNSMNRLNLSLLVQNPINFNPIYSNTAPNNNFSSSNLLNNNNNAQNSQDIIIYNKAQLYSLYNTLKVNTEASGVIILENDIRIGPLEPQGSFETGLKLIGNVKGIFSLDGLKIFDVATGDGLDFGKLIEVFVV
ncbi:hypothetical protein KGF57_003811 [Candida theae]|uniref:Trafficking protein particle complex II-specific subunit 65 IgD3 domain-containing protein n=1 Tax=Candida theae TaxID=1198502 RepID=A0AAD5BCC2_9ASCO|nr:uncharacterized protein KGF57_003811 [Candida theae]KAI5954787.1 hypothetical protein KGF57_003811 [Candida theae]